MKIGIAWRADTERDTYKIIHLAVKEAGGEPVALEQVIDRDLQYTNGKIAGIGIDENDYLSLEYANIVKENTYHHSNAEEVLKGIDAVIFTGGEDFSPTLLKKVEGWHGIDSEKRYNATRDVNDYVLMSYCIDKDIPVLAICRGMQLLAVASGAEMIQDIPTFYKQNGLTYNNEHRVSADVPDKMKDYVSHDVDVIDKNSIIYDAYKEAVIKKVPSWHHQAVRSVEGTQLEVTASATYGGYEMIEAIERKDKTFIIGLQFHPETAILKNENNAENVNDYMDKESAQKIFNYLVNKV